MKTFSLFLVSFILLYSCKTETKQEIKTETITFSKEGSLTISRAETDSILTTLDIEIAESEYETQTGLMYRNSMKDNQGMLFIFPDVAVHSFYMKNTEFALDIIYIDEDLKIASFQKNAQPFNETGLSSKVPVKYVLEVNAGLSDEWGLEIDDTVSFIKD
ncbi:hypothetical protein HME9304_00556 [Flagellimonas maritima]|uniref:DUF192 domain-containing protein n=1 Tax=Flagellimonas maritima TaxID=1383885 RepID=A0A2Z4LNX4_9FLAO|nr:DUF192 domain-containing protein [Allomuricauda aurantiaca]AWX43565.1 hypothetical protein HME9304_00556 [Allomuricauda aurantiaca]